MKGPELDAIMVHKGATFPKGTGRVAAKQQFLQQLLEKNVEVGARLQKNFEGTLYSGTVVSIIEELYHIQYSDGDEEDLDLTELRPLLLWK